MAALEPDNDVVIWRLVLVIGLFWLTGCASHQPVLPQDCLTAGDARLAGQFALVVTPIAESGIAKDPSNRRVLIASQWQNEQLRFVGFNAIGAKLFHGHMAQGQFMTEASPLYRGAAVESLMWGLLVHQLGTHLPACWPQGQVRKESNRFVLYQDKQVVYRSSASGQFTLPSENVAVRIERLE